MKLSVGQRGDFWLQTVGPQENNQERTMKGPRTQRINPIFFQDWSHRISTDGDINIDYCTLFYHFVIISYYILFSHVISF